MGDILVANAGNQNGADPTLGDQANPAVTVNAAGQVLVVWQSAAAPKGLYGQAFSAAGSSASAVTALAATGDFPALLWSGTEALLAAVVTNASGGVGQDIQVRHLDIKLAAPGPLALANSITAGNQSQPVLALGSTGGFLLGWTSEKAADTASGLDICSREIGRAHV